MRGNKIGKGEPVLAAKIGPGDRFWRWTDFFITGHTVNANQKYPGCKKGQGLSEAAV